MITVAHPLPHLIVRAADTVLSCFVEQDGAALAVSGTATLYNESGSQVAVYTITSTSTPTITILAAVSTGGDLSERWRVDWDLTVVQSTNTAHIVRRGLAPVVTDRALFARAPALDTSLNPIHSQTTFTAQRDDAWIQISRRLINAGRRPWLVLEPDALREAHMLLTLALIFESFEHRLTDAYVELAARYREQFRQEWSTLTFRYDEDEDGTSEADGRTGSNGLLWTMAL